MKAKKNSNKNPQRSFLLISIVLQIALWSLFFLTVSFIRNIFERNLLYLIYVKMHHELKENKHLINRNQTMLAFEKQT